MAETQIHSPRHLPRATARRADSIPLTGQVDGTVWQCADVLTIDQYPWYAQGTKQATVLRVLYDDVALVLQFSCEDSHIFSETVALNGPVCRDSCVEFFATIDPGKGPDYFNFEVNACGTVHLGWGPAGSGGGVSRSLVSAPLAETITVVSSVSGPTKQESPADNGWWLAARIPFATLSEFTGESVRPTRGSAWRCNAYRCGGKTDDQFAAWAWIDWPHPSFHRPEFFGELRFE
ncbi:MAG: carbohydrate-binding family 9-like protein [Phycisphaerae bacterium]|nr:carbohydrate-binding family 9-like protein [Phycisphaerae bacterium]